MTPKTSIYEYAKHGLACEPEKTAIWFYGRSISYRELFQCIDHAADHLYWMGVRQGTVVTIHLPNCPQTAIAVYATAKLGGICNIVHPGVPYKALRENMKFTESALLITGDHFEKSQLLDYTQHKIVYARLADFMGFPYDLEYLLKHPSAIPEGAISFRSLVRPCRTKGDFPPQESLSDKCVVYMHSSGTTSVQKTVMHSHCAFNNWVEDAKSLFKGEWKRQSVLSVTPFFHGSGLVNDLHCILACGGTQTLVAKWDPKQAIRFIKKNRITNIAAVPAIYQGLLNQKSFSAENAKSLSLCFIAGEKVPDSLVAQFNEKAGKTVLYEAYGMTEIVTACFVKSKAHDRAYSSGYPFENCYAAILDKTGIPCYCGEGEILVSTNTMMLGYLKDPELSEKVILDFDGKRWLKTGDIGMVDENGYVYFKDRIKHIIVRNGFNVFPEEIEETIRRIPDVNEVCVCGVADNKLRTEKIVAFVKCANGTDVDAVERDILWVCRESLPEFSVPNELCIVKDFPRNRMGKIDGNQLKKIYEKKKA